MMTFCLIWITFGIGYAFSDLRNAVNNGFIISIPGAIIGVAIGAIVGFINPCIRVIIRNSDGSVSQVTLFGKRVI